MAIDERKRHKMYLAIESSLGREAADTLMEHLPPVGWADVATKEDLRNLELRLEKTFLAALHKSQRSVVLSLVTAFGVMQTAVVAALKLA